MAPNKLPIPAVYGLPLRVKIVLNSARVYNFGATAHGAGYRIKITLAGTGEIIQL